MQQMTDKELLGDALLCQKHLTMMIDATASQTDDPSLVAELGRLFTHEQQQRLAIYQAMHQRGWYNPKAIDAQQVQQARQKLQQLQQSSQQQMWQGASWQPASTSGFAQPSYASSSSMPTSQAPGSQWTSGASGNWQAPVQTR